MNFFAAMTPSKYAPLLTCSSMSEMQVADFSSNAESVRQIQSTFFSIDSSSPRIICLTSSEASPSSAVGSHVGWSEAASLTFQYL